MTATVNKPLYLQSCTLCLSISVQSAHLASEVGRVGEDGALVGAGPDEVLHHVLLLGEVAVELLTHGDAVVVEAKQKQIRETWSAALSCQRIIVSFGFNVAT